MSTGPKERRRYPRLDYHIPMHYKRIEANAPGFKGSLMRNISQGGAKMTIYEFLPLNLKLNVKIPLISGARPVEGLSRVAWVQKAAFSEQYDAGIEFVNLNQGDNIQIAKFVFDKSAGEA